MPGLTAKVFRTYNASFTMANLLRKMKSSGSIAEKIKDYNDANRKVAILCNHKRTVAAGHGAQMEKMTNQIKALKYQKWRIKQMMIDIDIKIKKIKGADWFEIEEGIDKDWILEHQKSLVEGERQKIEKKFVKDNEKLAADGEQVMKLGELEERLAAAEELAEKFKKEIKTSKVEAEGKGPTIERLEANLDKLDEKINAMLFQAADKENNKEVALGTSKIVRVPCISLTSANRDTTLELHRSAFDGGIFEKVRCTNRKVLFEDTTREIRVGRQIGRRELGILSSHPIHISRSDRTRVASPIGLLQGFYICTH